jgi:hypothetical protein
MYASQRRLAMHGHSVLQIDGVCIVTTRSDIDFCCMSLFFLAVCVLAECILHLIKRGCTSLIAFGPFDRYRDIKATRHSNNTKFLRQACAEDDN